MKKIFAIGMAAALAITVLAGCTGNNNNNNNNNDDNTAPVILGVEDEASVIAGIEFDALAGITASDEEDGDLTSAITVESVPALTFTDGKATPTEAGNYELIYSVKDSGGLEGNAYCTLTVTPAAGELENVFSFDFSDMTAGEGDNHYWDFVNEGADATATLKQGAYVVDVTDLKGVGDDKLMYTRMFNDLGAGEYEFVVWASSSVPMKINMNALLEGEDNWDLKNLGGGKYGVEMDGTVKMVSHKFTLDKNDASVLFRICLGGNDNPSAFSFAVEKIAIYKTTGVETRNSLVSYTFKDNTDGLFGTDEAVVSQGENGADIAIKYGNDNADWAVKATIGLAGKSLEAGNSYYYSFKIKAENALTVNVCVEQNPMEDAHLNRASWNGFSLAAGEEKEIAVTFVAGEGQKMNDVLSDAVCRLYLGAHEDGLTTNKATVSDFDFGEVKGDLRVDRVAQDKFILFGSASSNALNAKYPLDMFNGSDDGLAVPGSGTLYTEGGKLIYKVHQGGEADWQSKLAFGYGGNAIELPENAYYTFRIKMKASKEINFNFFVHDMNAFDWDSGLIIKRATFDNNGVTVGTTETELVFETTEPSLAASNFEILFQFGSPAFAALGEVTIEISEFSVWVSRLA